MKPIDITQQTWEEVWRIHAATLQMLPVYYEQTEGIFDSPSWLHDPARVCADRLLQGGLVEMDNIGFAAVAEDAVFRVVLLVQTHQGVLLLGEQDPDYLDNNDNLLALPADSLGCGVGV